MLRTALGVLITPIWAIVVVLATIACGTYVIVLVSFRPLSPQITPIMRFWARLVMWAGGCRWIVEGMEHVDPSRSYVVVANHISNLDPPFHIAALPMSVRFLAKKELFRIPIFGRAMRSIGIVETDRTARTAAHRTINEQVGKIAERGLSLMIYPEGTRSRNAELRQFKKGAFRIAVDNGMPILPTAVGGTEKAWRPGGVLLRGGRIRMKIFPPIETAGLGKEDLGSLRDRAHDLVAAGYEELRG